MARFHASTACLIAAIVSGCATHRLEPTGVERLPATVLDVLEEGVSSREEILGALGEPCRRLENDRIVTYRLDRTRQVVPLVRGPRSVAATWNEARYSLVLVFDEQGTLTRCRLLRVR